MCLRKHLRPNKQTNQNRLNHDLTQIFEVQLPASYSTDPFVDAADEVDLTEVVEKGLLKDHRQYRWMKNADEMRIYHLLKDGDDFLVSTHHKKPEYSPADPVLVASFPLDDGSVLLNQSAEYSLPATVSAKEMNDLLDFRILSV